MASDLCDGMGKSSWPELLGVYGEVAVATIRRENRKVSVVIVKEGMMVTMDFRCDRVRVWVDKKGIVKQVPALG
ncbi:Proteinase inhibitor I13 [Macleaya cordata]|uniref:Proteinase inhibitor I13 n=1 Tax=Macleaya cordata TaxID=56857 RepID=A0A200Q4A5_MACCD|nr:Proteinase inhibitor I13 [Macleaya cordata]